MSFVERLSLFRSVHYSKCSYALKALATKSAVQLKPFRVSTTVELLLKGTSEVQPAPLTGRRCSAPHAIPYIIMYI